MDKRVEPTGAVGCLVAVVAAVVGLAVWKQGAEPGLRGSFEGERDWSLLYVELPLMLCGIPAVALATWRLTSHLLSHRAGTATRTLVPTAAVSVTVAALAWASLTWLDARVTPFTHPG